MAKNFNHISTLDILQQEMQAIADSQVKWLFACWLARNICEEVKESTCCENLHIAEAVIRGDLERSALEKAKESLPGIWHVTTEYLPEKLHAVYCQTIVIQSLCDPSKGEETLLSEVFQQYRNHIEQLAENHTSCSVTVKDYLTNRYAMCVHALREIENSR